MVGLKSIFLPYDSTGNNPYQEQLANHLAKLEIQVERGEPGAVFLPTALTQWHPDILHLHWLHSFFIKSSWLKSLISAAIFLSELLILRLLGIKIVWTVHNLKNHNNQYLKLDRFCTAAVAKIAHGIITHCEAAKQEVIATLQLKDHNKIFVVPHGNYINCYENTMSREEARQALGVKDSSLVLLFLGLIRPYKGVLELIDTFNQLPQNDVQLVIAGKVWNDSLEDADLLKQKTNENPHIKFMPGFIANNQIQQYMNACDVVVFPYRDILTSGAVLLAMSFGRACIAPRKGCIGEALDKDGAFLYDPDDVDGLQHALKQVIQRKTDLAQMGEHNRELAKQVGWERIAEMTANVYQRCLSS